MLYIHVGLPETGTTLLQRNLFSKHPEIHYIGKKDVAPLRGNYRKNFIDASSADLFELIMSENDINFPIDKARKLAQTINIEHNPTLVSIEGLSNGRTVSCQEKARRMKIIF